MTRTVFLFNTRFLNNGLRAEKQNTLTKGRINFGVEAQ